MVLRSIRPLLDDLGFSENKVEAQGEDTVRVVPLSVLSGIVLVAFVGASTSIVPKATLFRLERFYLLVYTLIY